MQTGTSRLKRLNMKNKMHFKSQEHNTKNKTQINLYNLYERFRTIIDDPITF